jgi:Na+/H+ antiporter NhaD/arsenite permease-like protein
MASTGTSVYRFVGKSSFSADIFHMIAATASHIHPLRDTIRHYNMILSGAKGLRRMSVYTARAVLAVFVLTYLGIAAGRVPGLKLNRTGIALLGAIAIMIFSGVSTTTTVGFINWPTILLLFGFFVLSAQLQLSGLFDTIANAISARLDNPAWFLLTLMLVTAGLSAFLNHDIVCYVFTPIVATTLLRRQVNPVPFLIGLAVASNIGAAATVVGNPQDMMIAEVAGLNFGRYSLWCITPVLFALGCAYGLIWMMSRHDLVSTAPVPARVTPSCHPFNRPHTIKGLVILGLVIAFFFSSIPKEIIALTAAAIHLASPKFGTQDLLGLVDWSILVLFMGLFVVTGAFQATGYGVQAVQWLARGGLNLQSPSVLAVVTVALSNLINNSAAVLLLVKVVNVGHPTTAYVLALANSFGGSLIILGSVSNIIVVQQARDLGINISFRDFARLGVPVTLAAMACLVAWVALMT